MPDFLLTFAGVPFIQDNMTDALRLLPSVPTASYSRLLKQQQPEADLIEEIDRKIPFRHLADFAAVNNWPNRFTDALAISWPLGPMPGPQVQIGDWYYPTCATRWGVFRYVATSSMTKAMLEATRGVDPKPLIMRAVPLGAGEKHTLGYTLTSSMYMLPPRPLAEHGDKFDGLYLITLVDERYYWQYAPVRLDFESDTTWVDLIDQLSVALNISINYSDITPSMGDPEVDSHLWNRMGNAAILLDAVAFNLGRTVVRNMDGTYELQTAMDGAEHIATNRGNPLTTVRFAGGEIFNSGILTLRAGDLTKAKNSVIPANLSVTFPKYVLQDVPHYFNTRYGLDPRPSCHFEDDIAEVYDIAVPPQSGGPLVSGLTGISGYSHVINSTAKAVYDTESDAQSGTPLNNSGLYSIAQAVAQDFYETQTAPSLDEVYPGTLNWQPECNHDIVWTYSVNTRLASCRVMRAEWNELIKFRQQATPLWGAVTGVEGVGGPSVAQTVRDTGAGIAYGVNLVTFGDGFTVSPELTSGGQSEARIEFLSQSGSFPQLISGPLEQCGPLYWCCTDVNLSGYVGASGPRIDDYNLTNSGYHPVMGISAPSGGLTLGGMQSIAFQGQEGPEIKVIENDGQDGIFIENESQYSLGTSGNTFKLPPAYQQGLMLLPGEKALFWHDTCSSGDSRWKLLSTTGGWGNSSGGIIYDRPIEICNSLFWCCTNYTFVTGQANDWNPRDSGGGGSPVYTIKTTAGTTTLTGIVPDQFGTGFSLRSSGTPGASGFGPQLIVLTNVGSGGTISIPDGSVASVAQNRIVLPPAFSGNLLNLKYRDSIGLWYDTCTSGDNRWRTFFTTVVLPCGVTADKTVVTSVTCSGNVLTVVTSVMHFVNGCYTGSD